MFHVVGRYAGNIDAARIHHVHRVVLLQALYLLGRYAEKAEHALRADDVREIVFRRFRTQGVVQ